MTSNLTEEENAQNQRINSTFPEIKWSRYKGEERVLLDPTSWGRPFSRGRAAAITRAITRARALASVRLPLGKPRCRGEILLTSPRRAAGTEKGEGEKLSLESFQNVVISIRSRTSDVDYGLQEQDGRPGHGRRRRRLHPLLHLCGSLSHGVTL